MGVLDAVQIFDQQVTFTRIVAEQRLDGGRRVRLDLPPFGDGARPLAPPPGVLKDANLAGIASRVVRTHLEFTCCSLRIEQAGASVKTAGGRRSRPPHPGANSIEHCRAQADMQYAVRSLGYLIDLARRSSGANGVRRDRGLIASQWARRSNDPEVH